MTGSCKNCDLYDNYYNTFTLAITDTTSSYYIHVKYLDESLSTGSYNINITCTKAEYETVKCGDLISGNTLPTNKWKFYQFIVDKPVIVRIDSCYSQSDIKINIWGKLWNDVATSISFVDQCKMRYDECGTCINCNPDVDCLHENFTFPITTRPTPSFVRYYIGAAYYEQQTNGLYQIRVTCTDYVTCGDSISSDIINHTSVYELIVDNDTAYVTLGSCYSEEHIAVKVYNNMNESISDLFCPNNGNYCNACMTGSCENCDLYDNYYNTFTLAITDTTSSYYIHVKYLD
eukprot:553084_1